MEVAIVVVAGIVYVGFVQWLRHQRRMMVHQERLAAIEKNLAPPPDTEPPRANWSVQRLLLLAGLVWLSVGISIFVVIVALQGATPGANPDLPGGIQWIGLIPATIGLSHLIVYAVGRKREK